MSEHNGTTKSPARVVTRNMIDFMHDAITLADLQTRLLKVEIRDWLRGLVTPVVLLAAGLFVGLGSLPVLLFSLAYWLVEAAGLSLAVALLAASLVGLTVAGTVAAIGLRKLRNHSKLLERSHEEALHNIRWIRQVLKHKATSTSRRESDATRYDQARE